MAEVYAFLAEGLEEVECLAAMDVLIRADVKVTLVSVTGTREVIGAHGFCIKTDTLIEEMDLTQADVLFLPGGMPGTKNLALCQILCDGLLEANRAGRRIAAICAAPSVLGMLGILEGKKATCYPGFERKLTGAEVTGAGVITDGNITTARGLGFALDLGLELIALLLDEAAAERVRAAIQYE